MNITGNSLVAKNISKRYANKVVVHNVDIGMKQGEIVGLFGPNGAGKTTLFSIIAGFVKPDSGHLFLYDQDITYLPIYLRSKLGISYLPQEASIFSDMNVQDNIKAIVQLHNKDKYIIKQKTQELLDEFSIGHLSNNTASTLSGGQRRRLEIARSLATNPKFIMLDEPLAGIDPLIISDIKALIKILKSKNIGVLITDHNVRDTLDIVDRAYIMYDGLVLTEGLPEDIIKSPEVREVYLGKTFENF